MGAACANGLVSTNPGRPPALGRALVGQLGGSEAGRDGGRHGRLLLVLCGRLGDGD